MEDDIFTIKQQINKLIEQNEQIEKLIEQNKQIIRENEALKEQIWIMMREFRKNLHKFDDLSSNN